METPKNSTTVKNETTRKPYFTPVIEQIQLLPDENILGGCYSNSISNFDNVTGCASPNACVD